MEKYGVELDPEKSKTASAEEETCPRCGKQLPTLSNTSAKHCVDCGTEPFEKRE